jgi:hypothetical protein
MLVRKVGVVLSAVSVGGFLSACGSPNNNLPATVTSTTIPSPSASSGATSVPQGVSDAKVQWIQGSCAASAEQGMYWQNAATDLVSAEARGGSDAAAYAITAAHLRQLVTLPDMGLSPTQSSEYRTDISDVNLLFHTPGLYLNASGTCPNT